MFNQYKFQLTLRDLKSFIARGIKEDTGMYIGVDDMELTFDLRDKVLKNKDIIVEINVIKDNE